MKKFEEGVVGTPEQNEINSLIMEKASDIAAEMVRLEFDAKGFDVYEDDTAAMTVFTEQAQDMFNLHYDRLMDEFYELFSAQLKVIEQFKNKTL